LDSGPFRGVRGHRVGIPVGKESAPAPTDGRHTPILARSQGSVSGSGRGSRPSMATRRQLPHRGIGGIRSTWSDRLRRASLRKNRSVPDATVIPVLIYPDVRAAVAWLTDVFGFVERVRIGDNHRSQLRFGDGAVIVADVRGDRRPPTPGRGHPFRHGARGGRPRALRTSPCGWSSHTHGTDRYALWRTPVQRRGPSGPPVDVHRDAC
jgi:hypothetical protein